MTYRDSVYLFTYLHNSCLSGSLVFCRVHERQHTHDFYSCVTTHTGAEKSQDSVNSHDINKWAPAQLAPWCHVERKGRDLQYAVRGMVLSLHHSCWFSTLSLHVLDLWCLSKVLKKDPQGWSYCWWSLDTFICDWIWKGVLWPQLWERPAQLALPLIS